IALAGGGAALTPISSGQAPKALACKPASKPPRQPLAKALSIYATPNPVTAAGQVSVFGSLLSVRHGVHRCGITITLWRRLPGQGPYSPVARTRTVADGRYSFTFRTGAVTTNREWVATARGLRSRNVSEFAQPVVTLASTATFAVAGDVETLS